MNRQQHAGTRRVEHVEHTRSPAGSADTDEIADFQGKGSRQCPRVSAGDAWEPHGKEGVDSSSPSKGRTFRKLHKALR
jgi:hypothetical protein